MNTQSSSAPAGLWRHPNFLKLWAGSTVSLFGSQITFLALPFTAVLLLHATASQMSFLVFAETLPTLLIGLFAGVWVDRLPRRPMLIIADVGRALLFGSLPILTLLGWLRIEYLFLVAFATGTLTFFFDTAYCAFLPTIVERKLLIEGNSKLEMSNLLANLAGPGLAGWLIQLVTAPLAIFVDTCSFLVSAFSVWTIHGARSAINVGGVNQFLARSSRRARRPVEKRDPALDCRLRSDPELFRRHHGCGTRALFRAGAPPWCDLLWPDVQRGQPERAGRSSMQSLDDAQAWDWSHHFALGFHSGCRLAPDSPGWWTSWGRGEHDHRRCTPLWRLKHALQRERAQSA